MQQERHASVIFLLQNFSRLLQPEADLKFKSFIEKLNIDFESESSIYRDFFSSAKSSFKRISREAWEQLRKQRSWEEKKKNFMYNLWLEIDFRVL